MAVTLYADNEVQDIRRIEHGVGQGFKFERGAVPSAEQVMSLAGNVAREQINGVSDEMVEFFRESAQELLAEESSEVRALCGHESGRRFVTWFVLCVFKRGGHNLYGAFGIWCGNMCSVIERMRCWLSRAEGGLHRSSRHC